MADSPNDPLNAYTIAEIALHLERRGFGPEHVIDISDDSWGIEHPIHCRLMQLDEHHNVMHTLRETCVVWQAFDSDGLARKLRDRRGNGRYSVYPAEWERFLREMSEMLEEVMESDA